MLTFNKLEHIFSNLDPSAKNLKLVYPILDEDGNLLHYQEISLHIFISQMREVKKEDLTHEETVVILTPKDFKPDHELQKKYVISGR